jgi:Family of unknown function (DUF6152)
MPPLLRRFVVPAVAAAVLCVAVAGPAAAHHGWEHFDTTRPIYLAGSVTDVQWGNPHPEIRVQVSVPVTLPDGLAERAIPSELEELDGRTVLQRTTPYGGAEQAVTLILAPIERLQVWGMPDPPSVGEQIETVAYLNHEEPGELRPELLFRADGRAVRQRSVPLPDAPTEADEPAPPAASGTAPPGGGDHDTGSIAIWVSGALVVLAITGGVSYAARRRAGR